MDDWEQVTDQIMAEAMATAETMVEAVLVAENITTTERDKAMVDMAISDGFTGALTALHRHGWITPPVDPDA